MSTSVQGRWGCQTQRRAMIFAIFLIACCGLLKPSFAQNPPNSECSAATLELAKTYHGSWQLQLGQQRGDLRLGPNPELAESFAGHLQLGGRIHQVAGDVEDGVFALEESPDGVAVSANWKGEVDARVCAQEIRGTRTDAQTGQALPFVLKRGVGWN
jgi:hypothetical protein